MAALKKKDDDMRAMEERYKMYLEKARNVSGDRLDRFDARRPTGLPSFLLVGDPSARP